MKTVLSVCGMTVEQGRKVQGNVTILDTKAVMPVTLINGEKQGKTMLITAGINGSEYPGILTAIRLGAELDPKDISGQIILIHPINVQAFSARCAAVVPEDGKNINRMFPGNRNGSLAEKIAYVIRYIEAKSSGCWLPAVTAGQKIRKGDRLGEITDIFGQILDTYFAEFDGIVLYQCASLSAPKEIELAAYGELDW